ncbi:MAG: sodium-dependent transporter [Clostridiales bacterium]|jgi:NSS family neurotransmitter:Na+ symporter|nr:sodium-dependent transporter [Clostridiales bacterium]MDR2751385.1 sodium-dependent transporter [Clostridiales bacterium]
MDTQKKRASFSGRIGFVLAAAGSAVGLGNIWRFPYLAAKYGGGIFLLVYFALVVTFGFSLMVSEISLGRKTGRSVISAYSMLSKNWGFLGVISALIPLVILSYYCILGGWVAKYVGAFVSGSSVAASKDGYFGAFISASVEPLIWGVLYIAATFAIVLLGVEKGIERAGKFLMPLLVVLLAAVTVYALTLPGSGAGIKYYLTPDLSRFSVKTILAALGQMFYSMSLAMGIMVTYGSYMKKTDDIAVAVKQIEWFDTGIAFLAGLLIVPAVFTFSGGDSTLAAGPSLMFVTMPKVFASMGVAGTVIGAMFFILVLFAALTSSISLMETVVSVIRDKFHMSRPKACFITLGLILALGTPCALGFGLWSGLSVGGMSILDLFDFVSNSVAMPIVALLMCVFIGYVIKPESVISEVKISGKFSRERMYRIFIKYVAPLFVAAILVSSVLDGLGILDL